MLSTTRKKKRTAFKQTSSSVWKDGTGWNVVHGVLKPGRGRPNKVARLFRFVAEKLPVGSLPAVKKHLATLDIAPNGVYIAHDSMGTPRYIGRGAVFSRLKAHFAAHPRELIYYSFFIVEDKGHEREVETLLIRAAGQGLYFNARKKRVDVEAGSVRDYEPGTGFYERQGTRGRKASFAAV